MGAPDTVKVKLLSYEFAFKRLSWREEASLPRGSDPVRTALAHALEGVSGLSPSSPEEARRVIDAIPEAIATRVWRVYRGTQPPARRFSTSGLYQAPAPSAYSRRIQGEDEGIEDLHDRTVRGMEARFGRQGMAEEAEISRKVLEGARKGGARIARATPEGESDGR